MTKGNIFRTLRADEIDVRVQQVGSSKNGYYAILLLYKDARVDMTLLDEHFGVFGWQREHSFKNNRNYCRVAVLNPDGGGWVVKEDVGTESNTEEVKGEASDAFKRACFNLGIGRELYSAPKIIINVANEEVVASDRAKAKLKGNISFNVAEFECDAQRNISKLVITDNKGQVRYQMGTKPATPDYSQEKMLSEPSREIPRRVEDPQPNDTNLDLTIALNDMNNAPSLAECKRIWMQWPVFHTNSEFKAATNARKKYFETH